MNGAFRLEDRPIVYTIEQCLRGGERGDEMLDLALDPSVDSRFEPQKTEPWSERLPRLLLDGLDKVAVALVALVALLKQGWERSRCNGFNSRGGRRILLPFSRGARCFRLTFVSAWAPRLSCLA